MFKHACSMEETGNHSFQILLGIWVCHECVALEGSPEWLLWVARCQSHYNLQCIILKKLDKIMTPKHLCKHQSAEWEDGTITCYTIILGDGQTS